MRIGFTTEADVELLDWAKQNRFGSIEWLRFDQSFAAPGRERWREDSEWFGAEAKKREVRISAIGAYYRNPLAPAQLEAARTVLYRAIDVAALLGIRTVASFPGAVIQTTIHSRGGNPVYDPLENFLPQIVAFWEPIAHYAADHGVRLAFEHCPQGPFHLPVMHYNIFGQPAMWERFFNATPCANIGLEWDPAHLLCQFIDPVENLRKFGAKVFHVHAKDAFIHRELLATYGLCHPGVAEHRLPGFGQANWSEIIHELIRAGYDSDLNIEGYHDPVFKDHPAEAKTPLAGKKLEREGWRRAQQHLQQYLPTPS